MIAYIQGKLVEKNKEHAIIEVEGVGYQIWISTQTYQELPSEGTQIQLTTYHHITDNDQRLFGFYSADEKQLFEALITVKNIGPKLGLNILSGLPANQIRQSIAEQDTKALSSISGIGKKTAERIVLELKDEMQTAVEESGGTVDAEQQESQRTREAVSALEALGYKKGKAEQAVQKAIKHDNNNAGVNNLVKLALKKINQQ